MRTLSCLLALVTLANPAPSMAVEPMQLQCKMTTLGVSRDSETPSDFTFRVVSGQPAKLVLVAQTNRSEVVNYGLERELAITDTDVGFSATSNGVEGISFTRSDAGRFAVSWSGCDHETDRSGGLALTHCGFHAGGEGTCIVVAESKGSE